MNTKLLAGGWLASFFVVAASAILLLAPMGFAQVSTDTTGTGNSLKISPVRTEITLRPGESKNVNVYIENLETKPVILKPVENDFVAGDEEEGIASIILDENKYAPTHSLKRFMSPLEVITVNPGERKTVALPISVPADAQAGGYYGALRFVPSDAQGNLNVNVTGSVASLILLTVPGNLVESLQMTDFIVQKDGKPMDRFLQSPEKVSVVLRLQNRGNIHVTPFGQVSVTKDGEEVFSKNINDTKPKGSVLPDSARRFEVPIKNLGTFGKYKFMAIVGYGSGGDTLEVEQEVWIIPSSYIVGALIAGLVLIVLIVVVVLALKSYKAKILRSTRRR
jgi:hypothetical protein